MTIFVDMDMVLVDYYAGIMEYAKKFNDKVEPNREKHLQKISTKYWLSDFFTEKEAIEVKKNIFHTFSFWEDMPFLENAIEIFRKLYEKYDVYIATSAFISESEVCIVGKYRCVQKHLPFFDIGKLIYCQHKQKLCGDYLIDDMTWMWDDFLGKVVAFEYPYNHKYNKHRITVKNWKGIELIFQV